MSQWSRQWTRLAVGGTALAVWAGLVTAPACALDNPFTKFARGLMNVAKSPAEVPVAVGHSVESGEKPYLVPFSPAVGAARTGLRALMGAIEMATFFLPPYDKPMYDHPLGESALDQ